MKITVYKDLTKYTLTSQLTKADFELVAKYRPEALKKKDADGNDVFAVSYLEGHPCIAPRGVTFGASTQTGGFAMIVGDIPTTLPAGQTVNDYLADKVGAAIVPLEEMEAGLPAVVEDIKASRAALIGTITEV